MEILAVIISVITMASVVFLAVRLNRAESAPQNEKAIDLIQKQMEEIRGSINKLYPDLTATLQNVDKNVNARLDNAAKVIGDVKRSLGEVHETTKQVQEIGKDIASLQEILRAPKIRGGMGELFLSDLLKQVIPPSNYKLQHRFKSGEAVDAVITLKDKMVPIDSKFPLESFKRFLEAKTEAEKIKEKKEFIRRVKAHISDISKKYILPDEGTFDFALMYIPAENVYYEIIIKDENLDDEKSVFKFAVDNKVVPVSPNSFYGYLQTILVGLRGMHIEERAQVILQDLARLEGDFSRVMEDFNKMGTHLKNLTGSYEAADKRLSKFGDKLESLETKPEALPLKD